MSARKRHKGACPAARFRSSSSRMSFYWSLGLSRPPRGRIHQPSRQCLLVYRLPYLFPPYDNLKTRLTTLALPFVNVTWRTLALEAHLKRDGPAMSGCPCVGGFPLTDLTAIADRALTKESVSAFVYEADFLPTKPHELPSHE